MTSKNKTYVTLERKEAKAVVRMPSARDKLLAMRDHIRVLSEVAHLLYDKSLWETKGSVEARKYESFSFNQIHTKYRDVEKNALGEVVSSKTQDRIVALLEPTKDHYYRGISDTRFVLELLANSTERLFGGNGHDEGTEYDSDMTGSGYSYDRVTDKIGGRVGADGVIPSAVQCSVGYSSFYRVGPKMFCFEARATPEKVEFQLEPRELNEKRIEELKRFTEEMLVRRYKIVPEATHEAFRELKKPKKKKA